jgi:anti-anti-sigma regulatory factor
MDHDSSPVIVHLLPALTIDRAFELKAEITKALEASDLVHLDFSHVEELDLACLQLIYAARSTAKTTGKRIGLVGLPSPHATKRLAAAGFLHPNPGTDENPLETALIDG